MLLIAPRATSCSGQPEPVRPVPRLPYGQPPISTKFTQQLLALACWTVRGSHEYASKHCRFAVERLNLIDAAVHSVEMADIFPCMPKTHTQG